MLGLVADSVHKMLRSLSTIKPNSSISRPTLRIISGLLQICFSPALACADTKLAAFTVEGKMFVFGREETADKSSSGGASVKVTGAGGNGFSVRCDLLHPQKTYKVREKVINCFLGLGLSSSE